MSATPSASQSSETKSADHRDLNVDGKVDAKEHLIAAEKLLEESERTVQQARQETAEAIQAAAEEKEPALAAAAAKLNSVLEDAAEDIEDAIEGAKKLISDAVPDVIEDNVIFLWRTVAEPIFGDFIRFLNTRGSIVDLSLGFIVGRQMQQFFTAAVDDIFKPLFALIGITAAGANGMRVLRPGKSGKTSYENLQAARADGAIVMATGHFKGAVVDLFSIAFALFLIAKVFGIVQRYRAARLPPAKSKKCGRCLENVNVGATACKWCGSDITN